jgi:sugar-specific transcriptional regulator TrmB
VSLSEEALLIETLLDLGLSEREAKIYFFLVRGGPKKARSIAEALAMNKVAVYRALRNLEKMNLVESLLKHPSHFVACPYETLKSFLDMEENRIKKLSEIVKSLCEKTERFWDAYPVEESNGKFSVVEGAKQIMHRIILILSRAEKEVLVVNSGTYPWRFDLFGDLLAQIAKCSKKGVTSRIIINKSEENVNALIHFKNELNKRARCEVRIAMLDRFFPSFVIRDNYEGIIYLAGSPDKCKAIYLQNKYALYPYKLTFESCWKINC